MKQLLLIPNVLHPEAQLVMAIPKIDALIAESERGARLFLKRFQLSPMPVYLLNEHTKNPKILLDCPEKIVGLISDAGMPILADPGAQLIAYARQRKIAVAIHAPGPSSIMYALLLSGFSAQQFWFHGYLPRKGHLLVQTIRQLQRPLTHVAIETPYRNEKLFDILIAELRPDDHLCLAVELTAPTEEILHHSIQEWRKQAAPCLKNRPAVFVMSLH